MKQYFKTAIKAILTSPLALPFFCLATATFIVACQTANTGKKAPENPRDLEMLWPLASPTGEKLVALTDVIPTIQVDLRYAKSSNVARKRLYDRSMPAMLDAPTARKLANAQKSLLSLGYSLKVWDAYRPPAAHLNLWRLSGRSGYVADPRWGWSKHCSGRAVDVTLVDAQTSRKAKMPTRFDDFSKQASSNYTGSDQEIARNLAALKSAMKNAGFIGIEMEWWHFENKVRNQENLPPIYAEEAGVKVP